MILAIDPGKNLGYAYYKNSDLIQFGQMKVNSSASQSEQMMEMADHILELVSHKGVQCVVIENIMAIASGLRSRDAVYWLTGTYHITALESARRGIPIVPLTPGQIKKAFTGNGRATKIDMVHAANRRYDLQLKKSHHNIADAIAIGYAFQEIVDTPKSKMLN